MSEWQGVSSDRPDPEDEMLGPPVSRQLVQRAETAPDPHQEGPQVAGMQAPNLYGSNRVVGPASHPDRYLGVMGHDETAEQQQQQVPPQTEQAGYGAGTSRDQIGPVPTLTVKLTKGALDGTTGMRVAKEDKQHVDPVLEPWLVNVNKPRKLLFNDGTKDHELDFELRDYRKGGSKDVRINKVNMQPLLEAGAQPDDHVSIQYDVRREALVARLHRAEDRGGEGGAATGNCPPRGPAKRGRGKAAAAADEAPTAELSDGPDDVRQAKVRRRQQQAGTAGLPEHAEPRQRPQRQDRGARQLQTQTPAPQPLAPSPAQPREPAAGEGVDTGPDGGARPGAAAIGGGAAPAGSPDGLERAPTGPPQQPQQHPRGQDRSAIRSQPPTSGPQVPAPAQPSPARQRAPAVRSGASGRARVRAGADAGGDTAAGATSARNVGISPGADAAGRVAPGRGAPAVASGANGGSSGAGEAANRGGTWGWQQQQQQEVPLARGAAAGSSGARAGLGAAAAGAAGQMAVQSPGVSTCGVTFVERLFLVALAEGFRQTTPAGELNYRTPYRFQMFIPGASGSVPSEWQAAAKAVELAAAEAGPPKQGVGHWLAVFRASRLASTAILENLQHRLNIGPGRYGADLPEGRIDPDPEVVEVRELPRECLLATHGLFVREGRTLAQNSIVCILAGWVLGKAAGDKFRSVGYRELPPGVAERLAETERGVAVAWSCLANLGWVPYSDYVDVPGAGPLELSMLEHDNQGPLLGNYGTLLQDPLFLDDGGRPNCLIVPVVVRGVPLLAVVALQDITAGKQLLVYRGEAWRANLLGELDVLHSNYQRKSLRDLLLAAGSGAEGAEGPVADIALL